MTENSEPIVRLGTQDTEGNVNAQFEVDYATDTGDALLRHISSGAEVRWNQTESRWELNQPTAVEEFLVDRLNSLEQNFIQLQSSLGDETQPVPGTSHLEAVSAEQLPNDPNFPDGISINNADFREYVSETRETYTTRKANDVDEGEIFDEVQLTKDVGTSTTTIFDSFSDRTGHMVIVHGVKHGVSDGFTDLILHQRNDATLIASATRASPPGRTYTSSNSNLRLELSADSAIVVAKSSTFQLPAGFQP